MLIIKNLKQKRSSKKLFYKFIKLFRITNKVNAQTYRLLLFFFYKIYNIFYISLFEFYHYRECANKTNVSFIQIFDLIDNDEM